MDKYMKAIDDLINTVTSAIKKAISENNRERTYIVTAQVTSVNNDGSFTVRFQEREHKAKSRFNHNAGDFVRVLVENGNLSHMTIIY